MLILEGCAQAAQREFELAMFTAYQTAKLTSYSKKLEPLSHYIEEIRPKPPRRRQTREEMIAALRAIKSAVVH